MQWLSWLAASNGVTPALTHRAGMAQRWLAAWIQDTDLPLTRVYLHASDHDWRNQALFFFDLAMVLRGVASASRASLIDPDVPWSAMWSRSSLTDRQRRHVPSASCRVRIAQAADRWSTPGDFLPRLRRWLNAASVLPLVDARLIDAATATMGKPRCRDRVPTTKHRPRFMRSRCSAPKSACRQAATCADQSDRHV